MNLSGYKTHALKLARSRH